jgi:hypothetical protein
MLLCSSDERLSLLLIVFLSSVLSFSPPYCLSLLLIVFLSSLLYLGVYGCWVGNHPTSAWNYCIRLLAARWATTPTSWLEVMGRLEGLSITKHIHSGLLKRLEGFLFTKHIHSGLLKEKLMEKSWVPPLLLDFAKLAAP